MAEYVEKMVVDQKMRLRCASIKALAEVLGNVVNCLGTTLIHKDLNEIKKSDNK